MEELNDLPKIKQGVSGVVGTQTHDLRFIKHMLLMHIDRCSLPCVLDSQCRQLPSRQVYSKPPSRNVWNKECLPTHRRHFIHSGQMFIYFSIKGDSREEAATLPEIEMSEPLLVTLKTEGSFPTPHPGEVRRCRGLRERGGAHRTSARKTVQQS